MEKEDKKKAPPFAKKDGKPKDSNDKKAKDDEKSDKKPAASKKEDKSDSADSKAPKSESKDSSKKDRHEDGMDHPMNKGYDSYKRRN